MLVAFGSRAKSMMFVFRNPMPFTNFINFIDKSDYKFLVIKESIDFMDAMVFLKIFEAQ